jgi:hypothetical protein
MLFKELRDGDIFIFAKEIYNRPVDVYQIKNGGFYSYPGGSAFILKEDLEHSDNNLAVILLYLDKNDL